MNKYFVDESRRPSGPFTCEELRLRKIVRTTRVWSKGAPHWTTADQVPELLAITAEPGVTRPDMSEAKVPSAIPLNGTPTSKVEPPPLPVPRPHCEPQNQQVNVVKSAPAIRAILAIVFPILVAVTCTALVIGAIRLLAWFTAATNTSIWTLFQEHPVWISALVASASSVCAGFITSAHGVRRLYKRIRTESLKSISIDTGRSSVRRFNENLRGVQFSDTIKVEMLRSSKVFEWSELQRIVFFSRQSFLTGEMSRILNIIDSSGKTFSLNCSIAEEQMIREIAALHDCTSKISVA